MKKKLSLSGTEVLSFVMHCWVRLTHGHPSKKHLSALPRIIGGGGGGMDIETAGVRCWRFVVRSLG